MKLAMSYFERLYDNQLVIFDDQIDATHHAEVCFEFASLLDNVK